MPIYEYRCQSCSQRVSVFFRTFSASTDATPTCSQCGSESLNRLISRPFIQKTWGRSLGMPDISMFDNADDNDPKQLQEYMLRVKEQMGVEGARLSDMDMLDSGEFPAEPPSHTLEDVL